MIESNEVSISSIGNFGSTGPLEGSTYGSESSTLQDEREKTYQPDIGLAAVAARIEHDRIYDRLKRDIKRDFGVEPKEVPNLKNAFFQKAYDGLGGDEANTANLNNLEKNISDVRESAAREASIDALTELPNLRETQKKTFELLLEIFRNVGLKVHDDGSLIWSPGFGESVVLLAAMVDANGMKEINDESKDHHSSGDGFLKKISRFLTKSFRRTDVVGRIGGDEFFVVGKINESVESLRAALYDKDSQYGLLGRLCLRAKEFLSEYDEPYENFSTPDRAKPGTISMGIRFYKLIDLINKIGVDNIKKMISQSFYDNQLTSEVFRRIKEDPDSLTYVAKGRSKENKKTNIAVMDLDDKAISYSLLTSKETKESN